MLLSEQLQILQEIALANERSIFGMPIANVVKSKYSTAAVLGHVFNYFDRYVNSGDTASTFTEHQTAANTLFPAERTLYNTYMVSNKLDVKYNNTDDKVIKTRLLEEVDKMEFNGGTRIAAKMYPYAVDTSNSEIRYKSIIIKNHKIFVVVQTGNMNSTTNAPAKIITAYEISVARLVEIALALKIIQLLQLPVLECIDTALSYEGYKYCMEELGFSENLMRSTFANMTTLTREQIETILNTDTTDFLDNY